MARLAIAARPHPAAELAWFASRSDVASREQKATPWRITVSPSTVIRQLQMRGVMRAQRRHGFLEHYADLAGANTVHLGGGERNQIPTPPQDLAGDEPARRHIDQLQ